MNRYAPLGAGGHRGPLGERLFDRDLRTSMFAPQIAALHPAAQGGAEVNLAEGSMHDPADESQVRAEEQPVEL